MTGLSPFYSKNTNDTHFGFCQGGFSSFFLMQHRQQQTTIRLIVYNCLIYGTTTKILFALQHFMLALFFLLPFVFITTEKQHINRLVKQTEFFFFLKFPMIFRSLHLLVRALLSGLFDTHKYTTANKRRLLWFSVGSYCTSLM